MTVIKFALTTGPSLKLYDLYLAEYMLYVPSTRFES
jgi:hypothetical protein